MILFIVKQRIKIFFKCFIIKNKKENNLQIWYYNIYYTNKIVRKNIIILEKARKKKDL